MRSFKRLLIFLLVPLHFTVAQAGELHWNNEQAQKLVEWLERAPQDGLATQEEQIRTIRAAISAQNQGLLDVSANSAALKLLDSHRDGCCALTARTDWKISNGQNVPATTAIADALARNDIDGLFAQARPSHPYYNALKAVLVTETDKARRATLLANMDRWRWMPRILGRRYLLVNTAAFEATLWQDGAEIGRWRVIVGKTKTPTPTFAATITGVTFNPWWEIPDSIVAESVGALMRNRPAVGARRGYVIQNGRYRQRPGDQNALGRMKLVMPNPYSVYLHDTPSKSLFAQDARAFSHGCVRVGDALGLANTLLSEKPGWTRAQGDAIVASNATTTVALFSPTPVYITYFTADSDPLGQIRYFPDIYKRDTNVTGQPAKDSSCPV